MALPPRMPMYADPDAVAVEQLIQASCMMARIGELDLSMRMSQHAQEIMERQPYDPKRQAKKLGRAVYYPNGLLAMDLEAWQQPLHYEAPGDPYEVQEEAEEEKDKRLRASLIKNVSRQTDLFSEMGWPASAQIRSALRQSSLKRSASRLASQIQLVQRSIRTIISAENNKTLRDAGYDALKKAVSPPSADNPKLRTAHELPRYHSFPACGDKASQNGFWFTWLGSEDLGQTVTRLENARNESDVIRKILYDAMALRRAVFIPDMIPCYQREAARQLVSNALKKLLDDGAIRPDEYQKYETVPKILYAYVDKNLMTGIRCAALLHAYDLFREAARRDEDSRQILDALKLSGEPYDLPDRKTCAGYAAVAAYRSHAWPDDRYSFCISAQRYPCPDDDILKAEFDRLTGLLEQPMVESIMDWFQNSATADLALRFKPGMYLNCPDRSLEQSDPDENANA